MADRVKTQVILTRELIERLDEAADEEMESRSHIIRRACREWLNDQDRRCVPMGKGEMSEEEALIAA